MITLGRKSSGGASSVAIQRSAGLVAPLAITASIPNDTTEPEVGEGYRLFDEDFDTADGGSLSLSVVLPFVSISTTGYSIMSLFVNDVLHTFRVYRITTGASTGNSMEINTIIPTIGASTNIKVNVGVTDGVTLTAFGRFGLANQPRMDVVVNGGRSASAPVKAVPDAFLRFNDVLGNSQYQGDLVSGGSRVTFEGSALLSKPNTEFFYFADDNMHFHGVRDSSYQMRSEIRYASEWLPSNSGLMDIDIELSDSELTEYTFAQVHRKATTSVQPPLRITFDKNRTSGGVEYTDHLFAVVRRNNGAYERTPLIAKPTGVFNLKVEVTANVLTIKIDDVIVHTESVIDWDGYALYFKFGVYLTGSAESIGEINAVVHDVAITVPVVI